MNDTDAIIELTKELVKAKDKDTKLYIRGLIDSRLEEFGVVLESLNSFKERIERIESKLSFQEKRR